MIIIIFAFLAMVFVLVPVYFLVTNNLSSWVDSRLKEKGYRLKQMKDAKGTFNHNPNPRNNTSSLFSGPYVSGVGSLHAVQYKELHIMDSEGKNRVVNAAIKIAAGFPSEIIFEESLD